MRKFDTTDYEKIKATGNLPSPKGAALSIIRLTQKNDVSLTELDRVIRTDPAFVGRLIKAANLVNGPATRAIASVRQALMVLGIPAVRSLALGFSLLAEYQSGRCAHFDFDYFWSHSLVTAIAFQTINFRTRAAQADEAFSVGLLSHIGELGLATLYPDKYGEVLEECALRPEKELRTLEHEAFFIDHSELTGAMLSDWGIPPIYVEAIYFHEGPEEAGYIDGSRPFVLCHGLHLAWHIANVCLSAPSERKAMIATLYRLAARLSIESESLNTISDEVIALWPEWAKLLNLRSVLIPSFSEIANQESISATIDEGSGKPMRLLIVDDDKSTRMLLKAIVEAEGYETLLASNGEEGFTVAIEQRPDIVITDWVMPGMTGIELVRALRQTREGRDIYVVMLTALENDDPLIQAFEAGADDFINKPLRPKTIAARLHAGRRMIALRREHESDQEELRRFASELSVSNRRLHEMAMTDVLTGFPNRRYAMDHLAREWAAAARTGRPLSCLIIDIDGFKPVNDAYGHDAGDKLLKHISTTIAGALRAPDVICRLGGDEFIVICPDTPLDAALACAERVRSQVEIMRPDVDVKPPVSVSVGVATRDADMANPDGLIKRADEGAYLAKQQGRNRVACVRPGTNKA